MGRRQSRRLGHFIVPLPPSESLQLRYLCPFIVFINNQPLRAKEASVCSNAFNRLIGDSHMYRISIR